MVIPDDLIKLLAAILVGGIIGAEREFRDKAAGFRTLILICVGSTLFTLFSLRMNADGDPTRMAANIVTGIGFLGAGVILRNGGRITGLTTAATIWLAAALGVGIGGGFYTLVAVATVLIAVVLMVFPRFERWIDEQRAWHTYEIVLDVNSRKLREIEGMFEEYQLRVRQRKRVRRGRDLICTWAAHGRPKDHDLLVERLLADKDVKEIRF
ncbi:MAG: MgtC/SapB family protein [Anaerolineae bacterium]|nr:MgtC/SapB family protein [Anaerolineae bacterium]